jgi:hypothetical protein
MPKPRLFICGDSFVDWDIPTYHWTDYLKEHYDVIILGERGSDNISIIFQLGNLPQYKDGDRIIMYWSDPSRIQEIYRGKTNPRIQGRWRSNSELIEKDRIPMIEKMKVDRAIGWEGDILNNEIKFIKKLKELLFQYNPIYVTWNKSFYNRTKEFTNLIEVTSLEEEGMGEVSWDLHPGINGCYDIYKILLDKLGNTDTPQSIKTKTDLL